MVNKEGNRIGTINMAQEVIVQTGIGSREFRKIILASRGQSFNAQFAEFLGAHGIDASNSIDGVRIANRYKAVAHHDTLINGAALAFLSIYHPYHIVDVEVSETQKKYPVPKSFDSNRQSLQSRRIKFDGPQPNILVRFKNKVG